MMGWRGGARARARDVGLVLAGVCAGWALGGGGGGALEASPDQDSPYLRLNTFAKVMGYIERSYVTPVDQKTLVDGAIHGMVRALDPHSLYLPPEDYSALRTETQGAFVGVGVELGSRDGQVQVVAPLDGAPAQRAGVQTGDVVVRVDGASVQGLALREIVRKLKGPEGTQVRMGLLRPERAPGPGEVVDLTRARPVDVVLTREVIKVIAVTTRLEAGGVVYAKVRSFQEGITEEVEEAWEEQRAALGKEPAGLVLDLRDNPGGLLVEAIGLVDAVLDDGVIVSTEGRTRAGSAVYRAKPSATTIRAPVVVLVNRGSASASEIVAGALQEHKRALVVGEQTYGKGSVQSIIDMKDGSGLKLTTALYYTPSHVSIHGKGIAPDLKIDQSPPPTRPSSPDAGPNAAEDAGLRAALEALRQGRAPKAQAAPAPR